MNAYRAVAANLGLDESNARFLSARSLSCGRMRVKLKISWRRLSAALGAAVFKAAAGNYGLAGYSYFILNDNDGSTRTKKSVVAQRCARPLFLRFWDASKRDALDGRKRKLPLAIEGMLLRAQALQQGDYAR